ncbi:hypothetical protein [Agromyces aerolatus]|uniref:hypothetical protein n=1 Tax=Agromyces sp. LY-1074 TaxID=3074080 RepID=UPI00285CF339|nr:MULTISPECIES: hypothetical protein [unclassified Agromyces]MDR5701483.1 hypothetical protein [Agromyces sp. LY-1074]MDR5704450.1 hypothetical protein [Agromyces sp. LY-1358]
MRESRTQLVEITGHIYPDESMAHRGRRRAVLEDQERRTEIWFELHGDGSDGEDRDRAVSAEFADIYVISSTMHWMHKGGRVHIHGRVTHELLRNLEEWQAVWLRWRPDAYHHVIFSADEVVNRSPQSTRAIAAFSGGLDAMFTLARHSLGNAGWQSQDIRAVLMVQGFDIPLSEPEQFERAIQRAREVAARFDRPVLSASSNFRELDQKWEDAHALGIAAALHLVAPEYGIGLIGSGKPYDELRLPWGSSPLTDHLLSSGLQTEVHDGAGSSRTEKALVLQQVPELVKHLRVCWQGELHDRNCGRCEKCLRTYWNLRASGVEPSCFTEVQKNPMTVITGPRGIAEWESILRAARQNRNVAAARFSRVVVAHNRLRKAVRAIPPLRWAADAARGRRA